MLEHTLLIHWVMACTTNNLEHMVISRLIWPDFPYVEIFLSWLQSITCYSFCCSHTLTVQIYLCVHCFSLIQCVEHLLTYSWLYYIKLFLVSLNLLRELVLSSYWLLPVHTLLYFLENLISVFPDSVSELLLLSLSVVEKLCGEVKSLVVTRTSLHIPIDQTLSPEVLISAL